MLAPFKQFWLPSTKQILTQRGSQTGTLRFDNGAWPGRSAVGLGIRALSPGVFADMPGITELKLGFNDLSVVHSCTRFRDVPTTLHGKNSWPSSSCDMSGQAGLARTLTCGLGVKLCQRKKKVNVTPPTFT